MHTVTHKLNESVGPVRLQTESSRVSIIEWADGQTAEGKLGEFGPQTWTSTTSVPIVLAQPDTAIQVPAGMRNEGKSSTAYAGKVVLIKRGGIPFVVKVKNMQDHGAAAVLVYNNVAGDFVMGGVDTNNVIAIPSVMITQSRGETLRAALANGPVNVTMNEPAGEYSCPLRGSHSIFV